MKKTILRGIVSRARKPPGNLIRTTPPTHKSFHGRSNCFLLSAPPKNETATPKSEKKADMHRNLLKKCFKTNLKKGAEKHFKNDTQNHAKVTSKSMPKSRSGKGRKMKAPP